MTDQVQRPHKTLKLGYVRAAIWKNTSENGTYYGVTFERVYKADDGSWRSAHSYGREDLLNLAKLVDTVHTEVTALVQADRQAESDDADRREGEPHDGPPRLDSARQSRAGRGRERGQG